MVKCRYTPAWTCSLYHKEGDKNVVDPKTCGLCMKAKEIVKASEMLNSATLICSEVNSAIRTMNTYTHRLARALEKVEANSP